ncbi:MAG: hypothetical protein IKA25_04200 [Alphaproteobacteria bacterium]|nr:hypothetical protein [Alphaproteobacteria bacterium]MBQ7289688.1 hypothetical protein [Alphaproteobacteria bacterium]MBR1954244.1 hypothetical protein [Alphaproteobacteria bacterium]
MGKNDKTQEQLIKTSVGNQYMATYAGVLGDAKYYECKDPVNGKTVGFVATIIPGKFGPMCLDYIAASKRARNIVDSTGSWWTRILFARQR